MDAILALDSEILYWLQAGPRPAWLDLISRLVDHDLAFYGVLGGLLTLAAALRPKSRGPTVLAFRAALVAYLLGACAIKPLVDRPRPYQEHFDLKLALHGVGGGRVDSPSFPSSHAGICFALAVCLGAGERAGIRVGLLSAAGLVGLLRVYGGAHYPLDVLGGAFLGFACAGLSMAVRRSAEGAR